MCRFDKEDKMKNRMKKLLALFAAASMMVQLVGCGGGAGNATAGETNADTSVEAQDQAEETPAKVFRRGNYNHDLAPVCGRHGSRQENYRRVCDRVP